MLANQKSSTHSHKIHEIGPHSTAVPREEPAKIKKISQLINRNLCVKKQINLNDISNVGASTARTDRKKKLDVSLSRQKQQKNRSISEKSANKSAKLKLSVNKHHDSIRKIKCFEIGQEQNDNLKRIKTPRLIQDLHNCHIPPTKTINNNQNRNIINVGQCGGQIQKRKIRIHRNK